MNKHNDDKNLWRGWSRVWSVLIPIWVAALIAIWFVIGKILYADIPLNEYGYILK